jgi:hypothetical protein
LFTQEDFSAGRHNKYVNLHLQALLESMSTKYKDKDVQTLVVVAVVKAIARQVGKELYSLMHQENPPGNDVVMGLAAYPTAMPNLKHLVGSLRSASAG